VNKILIGTVVTKYLSFVTGSSSCSCRVENQTNVSQTLRRHERF